MKRKSTYKSNNTAKNFLADKDLILSYLKKETTLETLNDKGIKVAMPI